MGAVTLVEPRTVEEASVVLSDAARSGQRVSIERDGGDVVLSTRSLDRVLEHETGDLTVTVEAGIRLSVLNERLAGAGQMLALDPPGDPTLGACLADDLSGPRRHRYGAPRDLVLGVTLVLADGTVASAGGKVVKNVAGFDLGKLVCGSGGRYALVARASVRLHPIPPAAGTHVVEVASAEEAGRLWQLVHRSTLAPSAVDLLWRGEGSRLVLMFEGSRRAVEAQLATARRLIGGEESDPDVWEGVREWQARATGRVGFPPRGLSQTLGVLDEALVRPGVGCAYVSDGPGDELPPGVRALAERIRLELDPAGVLA